MLEHLEDIESDMSAIHRVNDVHAMSAHRFFSLAPRLPAYPGVMQVRARQAEATETEFEPPPGGRYESGGMQEVPDHLASVHSGFRGDGMQFPPAVEVGNVARGGGS